MPPNPPVNPLNPRVIHRHFGLFVCLFVCLLASLFAVRQDNISSCPVMISLENKYKYIYINFIFYILYFIYFKQFLLSSLSSLVL